MKSGALVSPPNLYPPWSRYVSGRREIWIRKSWKSKYYTQAETRRDPQNNHFDAKRCFSRSPSWLQKIVNISNNATLDGLYGFWPETNPKEVYCLCGVTAQCLDKASGRPVTRGGARGAFAPPPPPMAAKVRILILNIQVKECSRLNWSFKLNSDI